MEQIAHYTDLNEIGRGGMGVVYRGFDTRLGRTTAIKVLPGLMSADKTRRSRFMREARAAAKLNHPNIATIYEVGEAAGEGGSDDSTLYIAMEYVEGEDLQSCIDSHELDLQRSLEIGIQVIDALQAAHQAGVVHRDLKPHNIRLTEDGKVKILDFGLAKVLQEEPVDQESLLYTREGVIVGTVPYMAPEQLQASSSIDSRCDLFSFGVVFYEMLAGRLPFASGTLIDYVKSLSSGAPEPLSRSNPEVSPELERIVSKLLQPDAAQRYQSASDVGRDLKAVASGTLDADATLALFRPEAARAKSWTVPRWTVLALLPVLLLGVWLLVDRLGPDLRSSVLTLSIEPFAADAASAGDDVCAALAKALEVRLIEYASVAVIAGERAAERDPDLLLQGECTVEDGRASGALTVVESRDRQILWGQDFRSLEQTGGKVDELAYQIAMTVEVVSDLDRTLTGRISRDSLKAFNLYSGGLRQLENFESTEELKQSLADLAEAITFADDVAWFHAGLSEARWRLYRISSDPRNAELAEEAARRAVQLDGDLPAARIALARVLRESQRYEEAVEELGRIGESHPRIDMVHRELGLTYEEANDFAKARRHYQMAVRKRPGNWRHRNQLGTLLLKMGDVEGARPELEVARELAPEGVVWPTTNLALVAYYSGDLDTAIRMYESVPAHLLTASSMSSLGALYFEKERFDDAERIFILATNQEPRNFVSWGNLGDARLELGKDADAREAFQRALSLLDEKLTVGPDKENLQSFRVKYLAKSADCATATSESEQLGITGSPQIAEAYPPGSLLRFAEAHALCGERDKALRILTEAIARGLPRSTVAGSGELERYRDDPGFEALLQASLPKP